jgi:hypothetical protein
MKTQLSAQRNNTPRYSVAASPGSVAQTKAASAFLDNRPEAVAQRQLQEMIDNSPQVMQQQLLTDAINNSTRMIAQRQQLDSMFGSNRQSPKSNDTGLPERLKSGVEALSSLSMDHVKVHYNSSEPAQLNAHAYAQGSDIHVAPGQEKHLPHEAWHVVQQAQGRVKPTLQVAGATVNDEQSLEREADAMGSQAVAGVPPQLARENSSAIRCISHAAVAQRKISYSRKYETKQELLEALYAIFDEKAGERIVHWVDEYEKDSGRALFASQVYEYIVKHYLPKEDFEPTFAVVDSIDSGSKHGPMMPEQVDRNSNPNQEGALDTFNFSSVTLGKLTVLSGGAKISFHDRQTDANFHAEDRLLEQLEAYIKKNEIETKNSKINLTINNFFCTEENTGKSKKSQYCLGKIIELQKKHEFSGFHVYFQNTYGDTQLMSASIQKLQKAGILVSSFTSTEKKGPYVNKHLNPHSESEDDSDTEEDFKEEKSPYVNKHLEPHNDSEDDSDIEKEASLLERAREYWQNEIEETVEQTNHQYVDQDGFEAVCYEDVEEFLKEKTESPFELDYVEDQKHLEEYMDEIAEAITKFIGEMIKKYARK